MVKWIEEIDKKIDIFVDLIISTLDIKIPILSMENVVNQLKGQVITIKNINNSNVKKYKDGFIIEIPEEKDEYEKRYIIAYELGHLFFNMGYIINDELWNSYSDNEYYKFNFGKKEYQAKEFAISLLMPRKEYAEKLTIECYLGNGFYNIDILSKYFKVSVSKAINRGRKLRLLSWSN